MKIISALGLLFATAYVQAQPQIVPLDMALGYWEIRSEISDNNVINSMLQNVPEAQRAQMRSMLESNMKPPVVKQCITAETMKNMDDQLKQAFGGEQQCQFNVSKSSQTEFIGELNCAGITTKIHSKVISNKRHEAHVVSQLPQMGTINVLTVSEWKSATCPAGL